MAHLGLGRSRKLNLRFHRLGGGNAACLSVALSFLVHQDWTSHPLYPVKGNFPQSKMGAQTESDFVYRHSHSFVSLASRNPSNTSTVIQYAITNGSQVFIRESYNNYTLTETNNNLELFLGIALRPVSNAPT